MALIIYSLISFIQIIQITSLSKWYDLIICVLCLIKFLVEVSSLHGITTTLQIRDRE